MKVHKGLMKAYECNPKNVRNVIWVKDYCDVNRSEARDLIIEEKRLRSLENYASTSLGAFTRRLGLGVSAIAGAYIVSALSTALSRLDGGGQGFGISGYEWWHPLQMFNPVSSIAGLVIFPAMANEIYERVMRSKLNPRLRLQDYQYDAMANKCTRENRTTRQD